MREPTTIERVRSAADRVLSSGPVRGLAWRLLPGDVRILTYHDVPDAAQFASHLDLITSECTPVSLDDVIDAVQRGRSLPSRATLITFDDGDVSVHRHATPMLASRGLPSVCFVIAGLVDSTNAFWWAEVRDHLDHGVPSPAGYPSHPDALIARLKRVPDLERRQLIACLREGRGEQTHQDNLTSSDLLVMEASGMSVESHSVTHPCLDQCTTSTIETEVGDSRAHLSEILGRPVRAFAYPNGNHDRRVRHAARSAGYGLAFAFDHAVMRLSQPPFELSRLRVNARSSPERLLAVLSGAHPAVHRIRQARR
jgi:peptidoglycan/xylan/chitin deacetylase (PgdA/CDA1 family)